MHIPRGWRQLCLKIKWMSPTQQLVNGQTVISNFIDISVSSSNNALQLRLPDGRYVITGHCENGRTGKAHSLPVLSLQMAMCLVNYVDSSLTLP